MLQDSTHRRPYIRRLLAATIIAATLIPNSAALAREATARDISSACPDGRTPSSGYRDVQNFSREVECIHAYGIDSGIASGDQYQPTIPVTRAEMATFLANTMRAAGRNRPAGLPNAYEDDDRSSHRANIDWLAHEGIVRGTADGRYLPDNLVTRAQLASYVNATIKVLDGRRLESSTDWFADDQQSIHEANINGVAAHGIVVGTATDTYSPLGWSTRGQMAAFLARTVAELVDRDVVPVPFGPRDLTASPADARSMPLSDNTNRDTRDRGRRTFTATVPISIERVTVVLLPAGQVRLDTDGRPQFTSAQPIPNNLGVGIEVINGNAIDNVDRDRDRVQTDDVIVNEDNQVTIVIDGIAEVAVVPVIFHDSINPQLDVLDLPKDASHSSPRPALETVAVGGATSWAPAEPTRGQDISAGTVREIDVNAGWYLLDTGGSATAEWLVRFRGDDVYAYTASQEPVSGSPGPITRNQFVAWLSVGDRVDPTAYDPGNTRHVIVGDVPLEPTQVGVVNMSNGTARITFTKPSNPVADDVASSFRLERTPSEGSGAGTWQEVASRAGDKSAEFTDTPPATGTWSYRIVSRSVTGNSPVSNVASATITTSAPTSTSSRIALDNDDRGKSGANRELDKGDQIEIVFDRAIEVLGGWAITVQDGDGTRAVLDANNATPSLTNANRTLTIHLGSTPRVIRDGADRDVDIPAASTSATSGFLQVIASQGIGRGSGWNLVASGLPSAPGNGSRTILDGTKAGRHTPAAAGGFITLTGGTSTVQFGRDEVVTISPTTATGGTYRLRIGSGAWSQPIELGASASYVLDVLESMPDIGVANVQVAGGPLSGQALTITFTGALAAMDLAHMAIDDAQLVRPAEGWVAPAASATVQGAAVTHVAKGDRITVHDDQGKVLGSADAAGNGRGTVALTTGVAKGQHVFVVIESKQTGRFSTTGVLTAS